MGFALLNPSYRTGVFSKLRLVKCGLTHELPGLDTRCLSERTVGWVEQSETPHHREI